MAITNKNLNDKLDKVLDIQTELKVEQAKQGKDISTNTANLTEHIRRTDILESKVDKLENPFVWLWHHRVQAAVILIVAGLLFTSMEEVKDLLIKILF